MRNPFSLPGIRNLFRRTGGGAKARKNRKYPATRRALLRVDELEPRELLTGYWTPVAASANYPSEGFHLLSNGNVLVQVGSDVSSSWYLLAPDSSGSYANGTFTQVAPMSVPRQYFATNVLPSGNVLVLGGEYGPGSNATFPPTAADLNSGEIYNPVTKTWTNIAPYPQSAFGDGPSEVIDPSGDVLAGGTESGSTYIYQPASNSWVAGPSLIGDQNTEEGWVKLPNPNVILRYNISQQNGSVTTPGDVFWFGAGSVPEPLASNDGNNNYFPEIGPGILLPDGRVFWIGATGHTDLYTPPAQFALNNVGTWTAGPDVPGGLGSFDSAAALEPNGKVLFTAQTLDGQFLDANDNVHFFEYDPASNQISAVPLPFVTDNNLNFRVVLMDLPNGQVLETDGGEMFVYTEDPNTAPNPAWAPTVSNVAYDGNGTYTLTGTQLNGVSEGSAYGDDFEDATNYPLVRLTDGSGTVRYAFTSNWSSVWVQTGSTPETTQFQLPSGVSDGPFIVQVVANGIASQPVLDVFTNTSDFNVILQTDPANPSEYQVLINGVLRGEFAAGSFSAVRVTLANVNTVVNIHQTLAGVPVTVDGQAQNVVYVGNGASGVQGIQGNVYLDNPPSYNSLIVDDSADSINISRQVTVSTYTPAGDSAWGSITGLAPASINYRLADTASGITIDGGSAGDIFTVTGGASFQTLNLNGGAGNDTFNVQDTFATVNIDGGGGQDQVNVGNGTVSGISGPVNVTDTGGSAYLLVEDYADSTARTVSVSDGSLSGLAPAAISWTPTATGTGGVNYLHILGGQGSDTWNVYNTSNFGPIIGGGYTWIQTGNGPNSFPTVNVQATTGGLFVDGASSGQSVIIGSNGSVQNINGFVNVYNESPAGYSALSVYDTADPTARTVAMKDGQITGLAPAQIDWTDSAPGTFYGGVASLRVFGGSGGNTWNIADSSNAYFGTYLTTGSGNGAADTVNVQGTLGPLTVDGANDNATVTVGSLAPSSGGTVANIHGSLTVDNQSGLGTTSLTIDDSGDTTARTASLSDGLLTGLAPAAIQWIDYHSSGLGAGGVTALKIHGGSGGNTFTVLNTSPISGATLLDAGSGNDAVNVQATTGFLYVSNSGGTNTVTVGSAAPNLGGTLANINGGMDVLGAGSTNLILDDSADPSDRSVALGDDGAGDGALSGLGPNVIYWVATGGTAGGVSRLQVYAGSGNKTFTVYNVSPLAHGAYLGTGGGSNTVNVLATIGALAVDGQYGFVQVNVGNNGSVQTIHGAVDVYNSVGGGVSYLRVDDSQDPTGRTAALGNGSLTGLAPAAIDWTPNSAGTFGGGVVWLVILGGGGGNTFTVANTSPFHYSTDLYPGSGNDTVNVRGTLGTINVDNTGGTDTDTIGSLAPSLGGTLVNIKGQVDLNGTENILVDDSGDATVRTATLTGNELTGLGNPAPIFYSAAATSLTIKGGKAADTYNIPTTSSTAVTTVAGGPANDTFNVGGTGPAGSLDGIQNPLTVTGGGGSDTLNLDDQGSPGGHMYVLSATTLSRDGNMPVSYSAVKNIHLTADNAGNTLVVSAVPSAATVIDLGAGGNNTLAGPNATNTWTITGPDQGTLDGKVSYLDVGNLVGGTGNDTFKFTGAGADIAGTIAGGLGNNTLDYSAYPGGPVTVNLAGNSATGIQSPAGAAGPSFSGITALVGNPNSADTLVGTDAPTSWVVTALNAGKAGSFAFTGIRNLQGGAGGNTFKINNGAGVSGFINGGGGINTLDYSAWTTGVSVNLGTGAATGVAGGVSNFTLLNGGAGNDSLTGGAGTDIIRGGGGNDTITGGSGNDILIGGSGSDAITAGTGRSILIADRDLSTLNGGPTGDIIIGGYTNYDAYTAANNAALLTILNEWTGGDSYTTRIAKIRAGLAGGAKLSPTTVHTVAGDVLNGQPNYPGDPNWYWAASLSEIHDPDVGQEQVN
jgi:hypothetical protein